MEYNTQREKLKIADYGRNVAKLIEQCKTLPNRDDRTKMANKIVDVMAQVNPGVKERNDYRHTLWDHLMFMANYELDVDTPYPIKQEEPLQMHPNPIHLKTGTIKYRHYGRALQDMIEAAAAMPEGEEQSALTQQIANTMKRQYLQWNRDSVEDSLIEEQLTELSGGRLKLPIGFRMRGSQELLESIAATQPKGNEVKRKKKKKKK